MASLNKFRSKNVLNKSHNKLHGLGPCSIIVVNMIFEWLPHICTPHIHLSVRSLKSRDLTDNCMCGVQRWGSQSKIMLTTMIEHRMSPCNLLCDLLSTFLHLNLFRLAKTKGLLQAFQMFYKQNSTLTLWGIVFRSFAHIVYRLVSTVLLTVCLFYSMCNSVYVSNCFALSWPGRNCKWELVLNLPTWLIKGKIKIIKNQFSHIVAGILVVRALGQ